MLLGLTAAEHEIRSVVDGSPPDGDGWMLVGITTATDPNGGVYIVDHWARRKDGAPITAQAGALQRAVLWAIHFASSEAAKLNGADEAVTLREISRVLVEAMNGSRP